MSRSMGRQNGQLGPSTFQTAAASTSSVPVQPQASTSARSKLFQEASYADDRLLEKLKNNDEERSSKEKDEMTPTDQPTIWWFASTAFPLVAGTFGPIANLCSVCALVQRWRTSWIDGERVPDPPWFTAMNSCSLGVALIANLALLFNFAKRLRYSIAQPITISFWYLSCILLLIPVSLTHDSALYPASSPIIIYSQSYYYAIIASCLYFSISTLLLVSTLGATFAHKYPPSFATLTGPQRTLMLQTISFALYVSLGAGVFSYIEGWPFPDGVYWALYTLLTIGLGTDFPLTTTLARSLLIPYAAIGITVIGLVVGSVRGLVLERASANVVRRHLWNQRERWRKNINARQQLGQPLTSIKSDATAINPFRRLLPSRREDQYVERRLSRLPRQLTKHAAQPLKPEDEDGSWNRAEFELMRYIEAKSESKERNVALGFSFLVILIVWFGGSMIFWLCEHTTQEWTYRESIYFTYTTLLTIGYGNFYPNSPSGKPFFVIWGLISVPAMTVFISNMGTTVIRWVQDATVWVSRWTILPERQVVPSKKATRQAENKETSTTLQKDELRRISASQCEKSSVSRPPGRSEDRFKLSTLITNEISLLARDLKTRSSKRYNWGEWDRWVKMLGLRDESSRSEGEAACREYTQVLPPPLIIPKNQEHRRVGYSVGPINAASQGSHSQVLNADSTHGSRESSEWRWTWLGDDGPLFRPTTETEWIIEKLCERLRRVILDEIEEGDARGRVTVESFCQV